MAGPFQEQTIPYITFLMASVIDALRRAFEDHPDAALARTKISPSFSQDKVDYPLIVVGYYGRRVFNTGISSHEMISSPEVFGLGNEPQPFFHYAYEGDLEFSMYGLDTLTRARLVDSLVHLLVTETLEAWSNNFFQRVYNMAELGIPDSDYNSLTINTDEITPFGDSQLPTPWASENALLYKSVYRTNILGQFMTLPRTPIITEIIENVLLYPYDSAVGETPPTGLPGTDPNGWRPDIPNLP